MKVKSLQLSNFRIFKKTEFGNFGALNVFIGPNASGKSTALQALAFLLDRRALTVTEEMPFRGTEDEPIQVGCEVQLEPSELELALRAVSRIRGKAPPSLAVLEHAKQLIPNHLRLQHSAVAPVGGAVISSPKQVLLNDVAIQTFVTKLPTDVRNLGGTGLDLYSDLGPVLIGTVDAETVYLPVTRALPPRFTASQPDTGKPENLGQWVLMTRVRKLPAFDRYEALVSGMLPHVKGVLTSPGQGDFELGLSESGLPGMTPAAGWSSGTSHLAMFLGAIASLRRGSVVLAEEPELSLHPGALRLLMNEISRLAEENQIQFFLTTHSDFVIEPLQPETKSHTLWRFERTDEGSARVSQCKTEKEVDEATTSLRSR